MQPEQASVPNAPSASNNEKSPLTCGQKKRALNSKPSAGILRAQAAPRSPLKPRASVWRSRKGSFLLIKGKMPV